MFEIVILAPEFTFDEKRFLKTYREMAAIQTKQAARAFLRAVVQRVPVDTGQARGTLLPLGRFLRVAVPISSTNERENKNPETGAQGDKQLLFRFPSYSTGEFFEIEPQLFYYWWNDFYSHNYPNSPNPTPWRSIEEGVEAFLLYMRTTAIERMKSQPMLDFFDVQYKNLKWRKRGG